VALDAIGTQSPQQPVTVEQSFYLFSPKPIDGVTVSSIGLAALIGLLLTVVLGIIYPGWGHLLGAFVGGIVAGLITRGIIGGSVAGLLAGIFSAIVLAVFAFFGFIIHGAIAYGFFGAILGGLAGIIYAIFAGIVATVISVIGGLIGGAITR